MVSVPWATNADNPTPTPEKQCPRMVAEHLQQRHPGGAAAVRLEHGGLLDPQPDEQADRQEQDAEQERHPPAPAQERLLAHDGRGAAEHPGGEHHAERGSGVGEARPQAAAAGRVLGGHQHGASPFASDGDALQHAEDDEGDGGEGADLLVGGEHADEEAGETHQGHGQDQHALAAELVAEVAEDHSAERPGEVARGEGAEAGDRGRERVERGEEDLAEDHRRGRGVQQEVVVLDDAAQEAGGHRATELNLVGGVGRRVRHDRAPQSESELLRLLARRLGTFVTDVNTLPDIRR
ncbi:hypothetical protein GCM10018952_23390 [Streptosporangium vulgare]